MKIQLVITGIVFLFLIVGLSGCDEQNVTKTDKEKFIGTWYGYTLNPGNESYNKTIIFYSSGYVEWADSLQYTYRVQGDKLYINYGNFSTEEDIYRYSFKNDYKTLILYLIDPNSENDTGYVIHLIR